MSFSFNQLLESIPEVHQSTPVRVTYTKNPLRSKCIGMFNVYQRGHVSSPNDQVFLTFVTLTSEMITALAAQIAAGAKEGQLSVGMKCHSYPKLSASGKYKIALQGNATVMPPKPAIQERAEAAMDMAQDYKG